jgi:hypothetical protein
VGSSPNSANTRAGDLTESGKTVKDLGVGVRFKRARQLFFKSSNLSVQLLQQGYRCRDIGPKGLGNQRRWHELRRSERCTDLFGFGFHPRCRPACLRAVTILALDKVFPS